MERDRVIELRYGFVLLSLRKRTPRLKGNNPSVAALPRRDRADHRVKTIDPAIAFPRPLGYTATLLHSHLQQC